jgi:prolipoprotein diacylglyceryl transferase
MLLNYIHWNIDPEIFNLFGISLRYYGVLFVGGLVLCIYFLYLIFQKEQYPVHHLEKLYMYGLIGIIAGARLGHCLFYEPSYYFQHPLEIFLPIHILPEGGFKFTGFQGLASHGGAIGLVIAIIIYTVKTKEPILRTLDLIGIVSPLEGFFLRLANLMNSEIIGTPSDTPWAFVFERVDNTPRHPSQLYEALTYLFIFIILIILYKNRRIKIQSGIFYGLATALIFIARFFIEFLKVKQVPFEEQMKLDMGQWLSIPFIAVGLIFIIYGFLKIQKNAPQNSNAV